MATCIIGDLRKDGEDRADTHNQKQDVPLLVLCCCFFAFCILSIVGFLPDDNMYNMCEIFDPITS